jgi:hypothetical protein
MANNRQITRQYLHLPYCSDLFITPTTSIKHITSFLFLSLHSLTARCYHTSHSVLLFASSSLFPPSSSSSLFFLPLFPPSFSSFFSSPPTCHILPSPPLLRIILFILFFSLFKYLFSTPLSLSSQFINFDVTSQKDFLHLRVFIFDGEVFVLT